MSYIIYGNMGQQLNEVDQITSSQCVMKSIMIVIMISALQDNKLMWSNHYMFIIMNTDTITTT